jgi:hypothetical protein
MLGRKGGKGKGRSDGDYGEDGGRGGSGRGRGRKGGGKSSERYGEGGKNGRSDKYGGGKNGKFADKQGGGGGPSGKGSNKVSGKGGKGPGSGGFDADGKPRKGGGRKDKDQEGGPNDFMVGAALVNQNSIKGGKWKTPRGRGNGDGTMAGEEYGEGGPSVWKRPNVRKIDQDLYDRLTHKVKIGKKNKGDEGVEMLANKQIRPVPSFKMRKRRIKPPDHTGIEEGAGDDEVFYPLSKLDLAYGRNSITGDGTKIMIRDAKNNEMMVKPLNVSWQLASVLLKHPTSDMAIPSPQNLLAFLESKFPK